MRQPTKEEARTLDVLRTDAQIAAAEHDLFVIDLREKYGLAGGEKLPMSKLTEAERAETAAREAKGQRLGTETKLRELQLRKECEVPADALLVEGKWRSPITRKAYGESE
jgi:hypothetical protein